MGHQIAALNKTDGKIVWSIEDPTFTNCWSTPILVTVDGREEMVFSMPGKILAVNPQTGEELWRANSPINRTVCASLCEKDGVVYTMGGRQGSAVAVRCGGNGDVSDTHTVWSGSLRSGIGTPIIVGDNMYWGSGGIAYAASCETGEYVYKERLPKAADPEAGQGRRMPAGDYASPIAIDDKVYMLTRGGVLYVINAQEVLNWPPKMSFLPMTACSTRRPQLATETFLCGPKASCIALARIPMRPNRSPVQRIETNRECLVLSHKAFFLETTHLIFRYYNDLSQTDVLQTVDPFLDSRHHPAVSDNDDEWSLKNVRS